MMYITDNGKIQVWYVGHPKPELAGRVIVFQADGHELDVILEAIERASSKGLKNQPNCK